MLEPGTENVKSDGWPLQKRILVQANGPQRPTVLNYGIVERGRRRGFSAMGFGSIKNTVLAA